MIGTATTDEMALLLGVTSRTVRDLAAKGRLVRSERGRFDVQASVATYCAHLREVAGGKAGSSGDLTAERTRLTREQADAKAIENELKRGHLIEASEAGGRWADEMVKLRARLLAVPGEIALTLTHLTRHDLGQIDRVLRDAMTEIADGKA